ncbi:MAG: hypothetical protein IKC69_00470 [Clostridia bacterium]|nr:hypothetical protein [Clostridia bacterium]
MKKRTWLFCGLVLALGLICVGVTYALLTSKSRPVVNTFVAGDIELRLTESTGSRYPLVPGTEVSKDPRITVASGSEECWLFVRITRDSELDGIVDYTVADGWTAVGGEESVFWRKVDATEGEKTYGVLKHDRFTVSDEVTEADLLSLGSEPKLRFCAFAVQQEGISTPEAAWEKAKSMEDEG